MIRRPPRSTLFPYTTLFRSLQPPAHRHRQQRTAPGGVQQLVDEVVELGDPQQRHRQPRGQQHLLGGVLGVDRKSTRLNSSHANISYAVFCLKKKKNSSLTML